MRILRRLKCYLTNGHRWKPSVQKPGYETCTNCRTRRPFDRGTVRGSR